MKAAQVGATEAGNNWIGYVIHHAPGPMMAVSPTVEMAKRNSKQRIDPLIEESAALAELIAPARIDGKRTPAGRFTNHSKTPNAEMVLSGNGDIFLFAKQSISGCKGGNVGAEITVDYRQAMALSVGDK